MKITFLQSLLSFLLHHFIFFFIFFWCKSRRDIRVTISFKILYIVLYEGVVKKSFFRMFVISLILINWFSLTRSTIFWSISESNFLFLLEPGLLSKLQFSFSFLFRKYRFDLNRNLLAFLYQIYRLNILYQ